VTWALAFVLFGLTIILTIVGNMDRASTSVIDANAVGSLATTSQAAQPANQPQPQQTAPAQPAAPTLDSLEASALSSPAQEQPAQ
ncbi:hypothetical protein LTR94_031711, partial [Friedmanniomyces endolithicus]